MISQLTTVATGLILIWLFHTLLKQKYFLKCYKLVKCETVKVLFVIITVIQPL